MARSKGQRGEREAIKVLQPVVNALYQQLGRSPPLLERNLLQTRRGGYDIVGVDWMALEVKRCETLHLESWWQQCLKSAAVGQEPILMYRKNRGKWRIKMYGSLGLVECNGLGKTLVDIALTPFLAYFEQRCALEIKTTEQLEKSFRRKS